MWREIHGTAIGLPWSTTYFFLVFQFYKIILYFLEKSIDIFVFLGGPKGVPYKFLIG
jgi:hypothetical protein